MNWNNMWNILFNRTELFGINMGFWVCLLVITIIAVSYTHLHFTDV